MAETASRELVAHLHSALDGARPDAAGVRRAMLGADRAIASRIAQVTASPGRGDGGAVRAGQRARVEVADRLGRRLPRLPPLGPRRAALRAADPRRHLPPARRDAARRRLARRSGAHGRQRRHHRRQRGDPRARLGRAARPVQRRPAQARHAVRVAAGAYPAGAAGAPLRRPDRARHRQRQHRRRDRAAGAAHRLRQRAAALAAGASAAGGGSGSER